LEKESEKVPAILGKEQGGGEEQEEKAFSLGKGQTVLATNWVNEESRKRGHLLELGGRRGGSHG